jgi:hypothetical protein
VSLAYHPARSPMRTLAHATVALLGVASFGAAIWSWFNTAPLITDVLVLRRAAAYAPAVLEVEWARFEGRDPEAVGLVAGRREVLVLADVLPRRPTGLNDLQDLMAKTERIEVLYDPTATHAKFESVRLRVLPAVPNLRADRLRRVVRTLAIGYGPVLALGGLGFVVSRRGAKGMGRWFGPTLFLLVVAPLCALLLILTQ